MEFYRLTIPIPKQPWLWVRFRIGTILLLIAILAILLSWRKDHNELAAEIRRLRTPYPHYEAAQAAGAPDVSRAGDSAHAWCPATIDGGSEWLELTYDSNIVPQAIVLHENYSTGAVVRITSVPRFGRPEVTLWEGTYTPTPAKGGTVARLPVSSTALGSLGTTMFGGGIRKIKLYLKTSTAIGWEEIDAVGLESGGTVHWATGAEASSSWGESVSGNQSGSVAIMTDDAVE